MKKMLVVNERFGKYSGAEQHLYVTLPYISKKFDIHFLYEEDTCKSSAELLEYTESSVQMSFEGNSRKKYAETFELLSRMKPDIIYVHKCMNIQMLKAFRAYGVPLVRMQHDHDMYCMRSYKYNPLTRQICTKKAGLGCIFPCMASIKRDREKGNALGFSWVSYFKQMQQLKLNRSFDEVFVVANYMKDELITQGFKKEKIHIFPPVPLENKNIEDSEFSDENIIIFASQIIRGKGLDCLIKAISMVKNKVKLLVFGSGAYQQTCEDLVVSLGLEDQVEFKGFVGHEELTEVYRKASIGAVPSVWPEPIATVGLEFLRHGLPVVGFDAGGIKDWLIDGETGFLLPWMDIEGLAKKIDLLLSDKALAGKIGQQGRSFVNTNFNFKNYIHDLVSHLENLVDELHFEPVPVNF